MTRTILVVDDEPTITDPLKYTLGKEGYRVLVAHDGDEGLRLARQAQPDVVVLDILLPKRNGWEVCRTLRTESTVPILMLTARGEEVDRVLGLELGADDYVVKPFSTRELLARIGAILRRRELDARTEPRLPGRVTIGRLTLDDERHQVLRAGVPLDLRLKEYEILRMLMQHAGKTLIRQELLDQVWGEDWVGDTRTLDVHVRWLREKIETDPGQPVYIQTVRGIGYRFATPEEVEAP